MRMIDADKFILSLMDASLSSVDEDTILDLVDSVPTVDAVPVVRCKDCKYAYINSFSALSGEALCSSSGKVMQQDAFCSYGERKDGGAENG